MAEHLVAGSVRPPRRWAKSFTGPNGNEAVAYQWIWEWGEKFSVYEDGMVDAKVSDWGRAVKCDVCGRKIVHVYWVRDKDTGKIEPYGGDHVHIALGYDREMSQSKLNSLKKKITSLAAQQSDDDYYRENYEKIVNARAVSLSEDNPVGAANMAFIKSKGRGKDVVWLLNRRKRLVMRGDGLALDRFHDFFPEWEQVTATEVREAKS